MMLRSKQTTTIRNTTYNHNKNTTNQPTLRSEEEGRWSLSFIKRKPDGSTTTTYTHTHMRNDRGCEGIAIVNR
jgi:hypothetical protein